MSKGLRVVDSIEKNGEGLNLTWEVRDGILHHTGSPAATLEGRVVHISDRIAYINHDIDDAVHAGVLRDEDIPSEIRAVLGETYTARINTLVTDIVANSVDSPELLMSEEVEDAMSSLRDFLFARVYTNPDVKGEETKADGMIASLYEFYRANPDMMPMRILKRLFVKTLTVQCAIILPGVGQPMPSLFIATILSQKVGIRDKIVSFFYFWVYLNTVIRKKRRQQPNGFPTHFWTSLQPDAISMTSYPGMSR